MGPHQPVTATAVATSATAPTARIAVSRRPGNGAALPAHLARDALRRRMLAAADAAAVTLAALFAQAGPLSTSEAFWTVALLPVWLLLAKLSGLYDHDHRALRHLTVDELGAIVTWATVGTAVVMGLVSVTEAGDPTAGAAIRLWSAAAVLAVVLRGSARLLWRAVTPPAQALIVGSGPLERSTRRKLELFRDIHVDVAGSLHEAALGGAGGPVAIEARIRAASGHRVPDRLILCAHDVHEDLLADVVAVCRAQRIKLSVVPPLRGMFGTAVRLTHIAELPLVEYHTWDRSLSTQTLKRCFDVVVAGLLLVVTSPLFFGAAIAIALTGRGGVLYVQRRAGRGGEPFRMYKFRTMIAGADRDPSETAGTGPSKGKQRADPRITRVGRVLRRWSLDELPQLVNVLRGDMSLVGPRPEETAVVDRYLPEHRFRLDVTPGMTGPMQVFGRASLDFEERLAVEREYLESASLGRDVGILLLTVPAVLSGRGAF